MPSPPRKKLKSGSNNGEIRRRLLAKPKTKPEQPFKTTGDDLVLRELTYYKDKMETNDEVHESIELCPVTKSLVDTEVYQRLRHINQLGNAQFIYTCANHNRFQHSLGVAFLAEKMCKTIKEEQPQLGATDKDVLCVKLAGLLHDLGHGPYSHLYESFRGDYLENFLKANPDLREEYKDCEHLVPVPKWGHERSSLLFIDTLLEELGLKIDLDRLDEPLQQIGDGIDANSMRVFKPPGVEDGVLTSRDFLFIKECIYGGPLEGYSYFVGRQDRKLEWLYDIVSNRHNGLDVDKIDYFARDHSRAIGKRGIDIKMITDARVAMGKCSKPDKCHVCKGKDEPEMHYMICYPDKHVATVMNFFKHRLYLHKIVYQHKTTAAVQSMLCDILCLADPFLRLQSHGGESFPISRAYLKSEFLLRLDDNVLSLIAHSTEPKLEEARELLKRFHKHDFYKCAVDQSLDVDRPIVDTEDLEGEDLENVQNSQRDIAVYGMSETAIHADILKLMDEAHSGLRGNDFIVLKYRMDHGAKEKNPLLLMRFYDKMSVEKLVGPPEDLPVAKQIDETRHSPILPHSYRWVGIRVLVRDESNRELVNQFFHQWFELKIVTINGNRAPQCASPTSLFQRYRNMGENDDDDNNDNDDQNMGDGENEDDDWEARGRDYPALLSQDVDDSAEEDNYDDDHRGMNELSPVALEMKTR